jgi:hypothetical protein
VAVTVAARPAGHGELMPAAELSYARLRGGRAEKLAALSEATKPGRAERVRPAAPFYHFIPSVDRPFPAGALPITTLFPFHREGVQTNRDEVVVDRSRDVLLARLEAFAAGSRAGVLERASRPLPHYEPERARAAVARALAEDPDGRLGKSVRAIAYRPFERRWFAPIAPLCHRPRPSLLEAIDRSDAVLLTVRKDRGERGWHHVASSADVPDNCFLSNRSSCRTRAFPSALPSGAPNLDEEAAAILFARAERDVRVVDAMDYALGLLAAAGYRARYEAALLRDYPRLLPPPTPAAFEATRRAGEALRLAFADDAAPLPNATGLCIGHVRPAEVPSGLAAAYALADEAFEAMSVALSLPDR